MNNKQWDRLWINATIATMVGPSYGLLPRGGLAIKDGKIAWLGAMKDLKDNPETLAAKVENVDGRCITPGLIDCHTHLVYGGSRSHEFSLRLEGKTYEEIALAGGGIRSTVLATRQISEETLLEQSLTRAKTLMTEGVSTIEIKSGYGLDIPTELKILRVAKKIGKLLPLNIRTSFLGAHALPQEYEGRADEYIEMICQEMLPAVVQENLADYVDVFCEKIGFTLKQTERVFVAAQQNGLQVKCHAEQLSDMGGSILASKYQALSVDHLEYLSEEGVRALAAAGTVAVLLPGAFYFLQERRLPPIALLRQHGVPIAIATDCNPGTSPVTSLLLMLNMACVLFRMTPEEALIAVTRNAARALGLRSGVLKLDMQADFVIWNYAHPEELAYHVGYNPLYERVVGEYSQVK